MNVTIVSVGSELVLGDVVDTNAVWLSKRLAEVGADVIAHVTVGDDHARIVDALRAAVERSDAVIVGGGLGPTQDDITREAVAALAGVGLERRPELEEPLRAFFADRGRSMATRNLQQADLPVGARAFAAVGTAPGFAIDVARGDGDTCVVYAVPGVPFELQAMAERDVFPELLRRGGRRARVSRWIHVAGRGESDIAEALADVVTAAEEGGAATVAFLAGSDAVRVRITATGTSVEEARAVTDPLVARALDALGAAVVGVDDERLEDAVARLLRRSGTTVATAESCTAGRVAARLAVPAGASDFLRGAVVTYATESKSDVLGIDPALLEEHGPVAVPTTEAMAVRARELFGTDIGLAVTCVAGPTTQGGRDVGTVIVALATAAGASSRELQLLGDRETIMARATSSALELLRRHLQDPPGR